MMHTHNCWICPLIYDSLSNTSLCTNERSSALLHIQQHDTTLNYFLYKINMFPTAPAPGRVGWQSNAGGGQRAGGGGGRKEGLKEEVVEPPVIPGGIISWLSSQAWRLAL